jgi:hypothetical protein
MRARSRASIGLVRCAPNPILLTPMSATPSWCGSRGTSLTGLHGSFSVLDWRARPGSRCAAMERQRSEATHPLNIAEPRRGRR